MLLARLINLAETGAITVPLWDPALINDPNMTNALYLRQHISTMLATAFSHVQP
jgi:exportin-1